MQITVPGSKSLTNRALILAALSGNKTVIENAVFCEDTEAMIKGLEKLANRPGNDKKQLKLNTGNAGTTTRFLTALCTLTGKEEIIEGSKRMNERPIKELTKALNNLGAKITTTKGCPPVKIGKKIPDGGRVQVPGNISSQFLSALLMIAPFLKKKTTISLEQNLCSKPYVNMTIKTMKEFGLTVKNNKFAQFQVEPQAPTPPTKFTVESDASSASYTGAFAALHNKTTTLNNIHKNSLQGDIAFLKYLKKMGCTTTETSKGTKIKGPKTLKPLGTIDMNATPDLVQTFAVLAMFTPGRTTIKNIANLRIKETDRLSALEKEIKKFGIEVSTTANSITIIGNPNHLKTLAKSTKTPITIKTYNDHRMAMSFAILSPLIPINIQNPSCVKKSYPTFWDDLKTISKNT